MTLEAISSVSVSNWALPPATRETDVALEATPQQSAFPLYLSPVFRYDQQARVAILAYRDGTTGDTTLQYPPEKVVEEYRRKSLVVPAIPHGDGGPKSAGTGTGAGAGSGQSAGGSQTSTGGHGESGAPAAPTAPQAALTV